MQSDVKDLKDRVMRAELWMIGLTAAIALFDRATEVAPAVKQEGT
jgi:hypothetical protein